MEEWEAEGQYPAHKIFKKLGDAGLMGINKPVRSSQCRNPPLIRYMGMFSQVEFGGQGLSLKYNVAFNEELGNCHTLAIPMSIAVQTDMSTPALAR